jgi:hypothetical protein
MQMQMQTMETSLGNELLEGEELIWSGRPAERGKSIASPARTLLIVGLVYTGIGLLILLVGLILLLALFLQTDPSVSLSLFIPGGVFFVVGAILFLVSQFARFVPKSTFYAITNRRVIILRGGRYLRVASYNIRAINQVQRLELPDGSGDLIFSSTFAPYSGVYSNNAAGNNAYTTGRQCIMSAIPNVRLAEQKLLGIMGKTINE